MVRAWMIEKPLDDDAMSKTAAPHMGIMRTMDFSSSTLWIVAIFHRFGFGSFVSSSVTIVALSSHLQDLGYNKLKQLV